jgi:hypothetical protein
VGAVGTLSIEGPGQGHKFVTPEEAAAFLRIGEDTFERRILKAYPWVKARKIGRKTLYLALDVAVVGYLIERSESPEELVDDPVERQSERTISGEVRGTRGKSGDLGSG